MFLDIQFWASLATLTLLEIVLGVDNIVFLTILTEGVPRARRSAARRWGLLLAMFTRLGLLFSITWLATLDGPLFTFLGGPVSVRDLILASGGLFLLAKGTLEIHKSVEGLDDSGPAQAPRKSRFMVVLVQIALLDIVFSLDSVLTAVGMTTYLPVMVAAIVVAIVVMMLAANPLAEFIHTHPTIRMLALSFLILVGMMLVADGAGYHVSRGYLYFAIGFAVFVEGMNTLARRRNPGGSG